MTKKKAGKANDEYYNMKKKAFLNVKSFKKKQNIFILLLDVC